MTTYGRFAEDTTENELKRKYAREAAEAAAYREIKAAVDAKMAHQEIEWTLEITIARRAEWNAFAKSLVASPGTPIGLQVATREREQGWTVNALKMAVTRHGL